jgi:hypothetical protein
MDADDGKHTRRVAVYMEMLIAYMDNLEHIFLSQSPYKEHYCHSIMGRAHAYNGLMEKTTHSVKVISAYIADNCTAAWIYKHSSTYNRTGPFRECVRQGVVDMMRQSYMLVHDGVLVLNATSCREANTLEFSKHVMNMQTLLRALILTTPSNVNRKITIHAMGEVAKVCANPVVTFFRGTGTHQVSMLAGANPASVASFSLTR